MFRTRAGLSGDRFLRALIAVMAVAALCATVAPAAMAGSHRRQLRDRREYAGLPRPGRAHATGSAKPSHRPEPADHHDPVHRRDRQERHDSFGMGSKQEEPGGWACVLGSAPAKDDIRTGAVGFRTIAGKQYAYVNFTRDGTSGSADLDYEFNQSSQPNPSCPALPKSTAGDIVIAFDAEQGGAVIRSAPSSGWATRLLGTFQELPTGSKGVTFDGATNGDGSNKTGNFGEAVLNLTDTIGDVTCGEFTSVFMKSRSSNEINSALQDRTTTKPVATGLCPISTSPRRSGTSRPARPAFATSANAGPGDTIEYKLTYKNNGPVPATNVDDHRSAGRRPDQLRQLHRRLHQQTTGRSPGTSASIPAGAREEIDLQGHARTRASPTAIRRSRTSVRPKATEEPEPTSSNATTVTVKAAPKSELKKAVRK